MQQRNSAALRCLLRCGFATANLVTISYISHRGGGGGARRAGRQGGTGRRVFRSCGLPSNKTSLKKDRARHRLRRRPRTWRTGERTSLFIASATPDASCWRSRDLAGDKCEGPSFRDPARDPIAPLANDGKPSAEQPLCRSPNLPRLYMYKGPIRAALPQAPTGTGTQPQRPSSQGVR